MITIDLKKIKEALPKRAEIQFGKIGRTKKHIVPFLDIRIEPKLSSDDFDMCTDWISNIIGQENIMAVHMEEEENMRWFIYLKRKPMEFINA